MANSDMVGKKMIAPDGGWGWVIVIAYALNNVIMVPILQNFSLVLKHVFEKLRVAGTDATIIISTNAAFGMSVGLIHGPLLRIYGYRKIAMIGSTLFIFGITMTAFATTFTHFMVTYGFMASLGVGLTMSAFSLAVNTYFVKQRGRAMGIAMTITGLGPIVMPQLLSFLLSFYGTQGTILIAGGLTLHTLVASLLLQPVKWHAKWQVETVEDDATNTTKEVDKNFVESVEPMEIDETIVTDEKARKRKSSPKTDEIHKRKNCIHHKKSTTRHDEQEECNSDDRVVSYNWWNSENSLETVNLGSSTMVLDENKTFGTLTIDNNSETESKSLKEFDAIPGKKVQLLAEKTLVQKDIREPIANEVIPERSCCHCWDITKSNWQNATRRIVEFFDFDLLRDPLYVNLMLGMSIASFAEINFPLLIPFILGDMKFDTQKTATVMSTIAAVDLLSRGFVPYLSEWLRLSARSMALLSLFLLMYCRTMLIFSSRYVTVLTIAGGLGFAKGIRAVTMSLVIPNYVPIERLASATGIQMVVNGLVLVLLGPLPGLAHDKFGSYVPALILMNLATATTIIMWVTEMCIVSRNTRRRQREQQGIYKQLTTILSKSIPSDGTDISKHKEDLKTMDIDVSYTALSNHDCCTNYPK